MNLNLPKIEEKILKFWKKNKIFEKGLKKTQKGPRFVFYEGPPFANGLPGIHHLLSRAFKDIILRYKTMNGFFIERKAGWDTHGLPTEMAAEKKLCIKSKREIEKLGIAKFIRECKKNVFTYKKEWEEFTERIGFWLDLKNAYITCSDDYIESLWWILKKIWEKGLLYQDYKVVPYCPRCCTSLSSHEVAQGYKLIKEPAIYVKFKVKSQNSKLKTTPNKFLAEARNYTGQATQNSKLTTYFLAWTTTPWTLPGNMALAVNPNFTYAKIKVDNEELILAKERIEASGIRGEIVEEFKGKDLVGLEYEPLYKFQISNFKLQIASFQFQVLTGDFVSLEEGTGIVHIAPAFGEEDLRIGKENNLPVLMTIDGEGKFKPEVKEWSGKLVKEADPLIIEDLKKRNLLFKEESYEHEYPFCWRCETPLLYYAKDSWFIKMTSLKKDLIENSQKINWFPEYLKEGRFGEWLKEIKDWNLSRERYWGTPLPVWLCQTGRSQKSKVKSQKFCDNIKVIGSIRELEKLSGKKIKDLHRPYIDKITFKCEKCAGRMKRVPEVVDCWFDSGAMPFAQGHWPFAQSQKSKVKSQKLRPPELFPADYIAEGLDQTRGWFYTLLAVSTLLGLGTPYKNVISHGIVLDANGQKMSKSKGNIILPSEVLKKFGADCARFYFYTLNPVAEPKRFDFREVEILSRRFFDTLWNCYLFFETYGIRKLKTNHSPFSMGWVAQPRPPAGGRGCGKNQKLKTKNLLDKWIISRLQNLNKKLIENLDKYYIIEAARLFDEFLVDDLSNWYIRRSRRRFQKPENLQEKTQASQVLYDVLLSLAKLLAPFTPFITDEIYQRLRSDLRRSVHLADYPKPDKKLINQKLEEEMQKVRKIAALALAERVKAGIKVRQPIASLKIKNQKLKIKNKELLNLIKDEINVKEIIFDPKIKKEIELDTKITPQLKEEGIVREIIRQIQDLRKRAGLTPKDKISLQFSGSDFLNKILVKNQTLILRETLAKDIKLKKEKKIALEKEIDFPEGKLWLGLTKFD